MRCWSLLRCPKATAGLHHVRRGPICCMASVEACGGPTGRWNHGSAMFHHGAAPVVGGCTSRWRLLGGRASCRCLLDGRTSRRRLLSGCAFRRCLLNGCASCWRLLSGRAFRWCLLDGRASCRCLSRRRQRTGDRGRRAVSGVASVEARGGPAGRSHHGSVLLSHRTAPVVGGKAGPALPTLLSQHTCNGAWSAVGCVASGEASGGPRGGWHHGATLLHHRGEPAVLCRG